MTWQIEVKPWYYSMMFSSGFFLSLRDRRWESRWGWREGICGAEGELGTPGIRQREGRLPHLQ